VTEVDLRWGIAVDESAESSILPLCLAEIDRCLPWFIGLLGNRYGWVPRQTSSDVIEEHGWVTEHAQSSVTELEIVHGVLRKPSNAARALFYFRDRDFIERLPADVNRNDFCANPRRRPSGLNS